MEFINKILTNLRRGLQNYLTTVFGAGSGATLLVPFFTALLDADPETIPVYKDLAIGLGLVLIGFFSNDAADVKAEPKVAKAVEADEPTDAVG